MTGSGKEEAETVARKAKWLNELLVARAGTRIGPVVKPTAAVRLVAGTIATGHVRDPPSAGTETDPEGESAAAARRALIDMYLAEALLVIQRVVRETRNRHLAVERGGALHRLRTMRTNAATGIGRETEM